MNNYEQMYKEAYVRVSMRFGTLVADELFPELGESEDERIRKKLIKFFSKPQNAYYPVFDLDSKDAATWLEKHKYTEEDMDKAYKCADEVQYKRGYEAAMREMEKQGEQKPKKEYPYNAISEALDKWLLEKPRKFDKHDGAYYTTQSLIEMCQYVLSKVSEPKKKPKFKVGDTIYYNSFGEMKSMLVDKVSDLGDSNPMYEDADGNAIFEKETIEQKPAEWSEEDKEIYHSIIDSLCHLRKLYEHDSIKVNDYNKMIEWLKSLRPQKQWKPSEEQLDALNEMVMEVIDSGQRQILDKLYYDLKHL